MPNAVRNMLWGGYLIAVFAVVFSLGVFVHENARDLEAPLAIGTLLLTVVVYVGLSRFLKRYHVLRNAASGFFLFGSMCFAIFHGWGIEVRAMYTLASLVFLVAVVVYIMRVTARMRRMITEAAGSAQPAISDDMRLQLAAMPPIGDDRSLVIHIDRAKVATLAIAQLLMCGAFLVAAVFILRKQGWTSATMVPVGGVLLVTILLAWIVTGSISRLVRSTPAIILNEHGIVDGATLWRSGLGLILWEEILGLYCTGQGPSGSFRSRRRLVIVVANPAAFRRRQGLFARLSLRLAGFGSVSPVSMPEPLLPMTVEELADQINRFASALHPEWADDDQGRDQDNKGIQAAENAENLDVR